MFDMEEQNEVDVQVDAEEQSVAEAEMEEETFQTQAEEEETFEVEAGVEAEEEETFEVEAEVEAEEEDVTEVEAEESGEAEEAGEKIEGTVKWFSNPKGYGFISREGGEDVFVHYSAIQGSGFRSLSAGERVEFIVKASDKGPRAAQVRSLESDFGSGWL